MIHVMQNLSLTVILKNKYGYHQDIEGKPIAQLQPLQFEFFLSKRLVH